MAATALTTESTLMCVIVLMAGVTGGRLVNPLSGRAGMAIHAGKVFVASVQLEISLQIVIENPQTPAIGVVALPAIGAKSAFMIIIVPVAGITGRFRILETGRDMAFFAGSRCMHTKQREVGNVVIEDDPV